MLVTKITGREYVDESTSRIKRHFTEIFGKVTSVGDTPGDMIHNEEVFRCLPRQNPEIFCLVFAGGYLHSVGTQGFERPGRGKVYPDIDSYLNATTLEEIQWLKDFIKFAEPPKVKVKYLLLIVNKLDLWYEDLDTVVRRYSSVAWRRELNKLAQRIAVPNAGFRVVTAAADYDSFKGSVSPSASFNRDAADLSVDLLRALVCLLQADGAI